MYDIGVNLIFGFELKVDGKVSDELIDLINESAPHGARLLNKTVKHPLLLELDIKSFKPCFEVYEKVWRDIEIYVADHLSEIKNLSATKQIGAIKDSILKLDLFNTLMSEHKKDLKDGLEIKFFTRKNPNVLMHGVLIAIVPPFSTVYSVLSTKIYDYRFKNNFKNINKLSQNKLMYLVMEKATSNNKKPSLYCIDAEQILWN